MSSRATRNLNILRKTIFRTQSICKVPFVFNISFGQGTDFADTLSCWSDFQIDKWWIQFSQFVYTGGGRQYLQRLQNKSLFNKKKRVAKDKISEMCGAF